MCGLFREETFLVDSFIVGRIFEVFYIFMAISGPLSTISSGLHYHECNDGILSRTLSPARSDSLRRPQAHEHSTGPLRCPSTRQSPRLSHKPTLSLFSLGKRWREALKESEAIVEPVRRHLYLPYFLLLLMPKSDTSRRDAEVKRAMDWPLGCWDLCEDGLSRPSQTVCSSTSLRSRGD